LKTAADCARRVRALYGSDLSRDAGVVHVAAAWRESAARWVTLRIVDAAPRSATDRFVLNVVRARADAVVTTGRILREEPALRHALEGAGREAEALRAWRAEVLGRTDPPSSLVLTSGRGLDLRHPVLAETKAPPSVVFTSAAAAERIAGEARRVGSDVVVVGHASPGLREAIAHLRRERGCRTIAIEAGPSTARVLYEDPVGVDELVLSLYLEPDLPGEVRGGSFASPERIRDVFGAPRAATDSVEESGRWRFERYRRGPRPAGGGRALDAG
jgi:riboflavin biosynthesis pyrimidine reductase